MTAPGDLKNKFEWNKKKYTTYDPLTNSHLTTKRQKLQREGWFNTREIKTWYWPKLRCKRENVNHTNALIRDGMWTVWLSAKKGIENIERPHLHLLLLICLSASFCMLAVKTVFLVVSVLRNGVHEYTDNTSTITTEREKCNVTPAPVSPRTNIIQEKLTRFWRYWTLKQK